MPLFRREKLSPEGQRVADSFKMVNSSGEFEDERAAKYMDENRPFFAADVKAIVSDLNLPRK
jgi:hypothetical protein